MRVFTASGRWDVPAGAVAPCLILRPDRWDDFGYKTQYQVEYLGEDTSTYLIGAVKIMRIGMEKSDSPIDLPPGEVHLPPDYASVGQQLSYYSNLLDLMERDDVLEYLSRMQDLAALPERQTIFLNDPAFETSLLREGSARRALIDAQELLYGEDLDNTLTFEFQTNVGGEPFTAHFSFGDQEEIPSRLNAIIGYNGVGKTRLLANLSHVAWQDATGRESLRTQYGQLVPNDIPFGRVVAVTYSAFDTFETPSGARRTTGSPTGTEQLNLGSEAHKFRDYVYCGLRDVHSPEAENRLKSMDEVAAELEQALLRFQTDKRWDSLNRALAPLLREPSFQLSATSIDFRDERKTWRPAFDRLSTGHKISLNIVVQLVSHLENKSLVLIDEPESHLHPPLLAALMKGISEALDETNSFAIIATHSPVVLQEIAGRYVQVLRRYGNQTRVERPPMETFGENVGLLTRTVFNLDNAESDYEGVLRSLGVTLGVDGLAEVFPTGLSSQALAIVMQAEAEVRDDEF